MWKEWWKLVYKGEKIESCKVAATMCDQKLYETVAEQVDDIECVERDSEECENKNKINNH